jgi:hypothetical protein
MERGLVYILRLQNNRWYVGWTNNPRRRWKEHFFNPKVKWLVENPPIEVAYQFYGTLRDESAATIQLAHWHGIANVRGGAYAKNQTYYQENLPNVENPPLPEYFWMS